MIELNYDYIDKVSNQLIQFNGFLPFKLLDAINTFQRREYLKKNGLYEYIYKLNVVHREKMKRSNDSETYCDIALLKWVEENPQFKDCIILD